MLQIEELALCPLSTFLETPPYCLGLNSVHLYILSSFPRLLPTIAFPLCSIPTHIFQVLLIPPIEKKSHLFPSCPYYWLQMFQPLESASTFSFDDIKAGASLQWVGSPGGRKMTFIHRGVRIKARHNGKVRVSSLVCGWAYFIVTTILKQTFL